LTVWGSLSRTTLIVTPFVTNKPSAKINCCTQTYFWTLTFVMKNTLQCISSVVRPNKALKHKLHTWGKTHIFDKDFTIVLGYREMWIEHFVYSWYLEAIPVKCKWGGFCGCLKKMQYFVLSQNLHRSYSPPGLALASDLIIVWPKNKKQVVEVGILEYIGLHLFGPHRLQLNTNTSCIVLNLFMSEHY